MSNKSEGKDCFPSQLPVSRRAALAPICSFLLAATIDERMPLLQHTLTYRNEAAIAIVPPPLFELWKSFRILTFPLTGEYTPATLRCVSSFQFRPLPNPFAPEVHPGSPDRCAQLAGLTIRVPPRASIVAVFAPANPFISVLYALMQKGAYLVENTQL
jgi:hypothetical protein